MISDTWRGEGDSDGDSADSEAEDCLQHAGVYTAEEVSTRSATRGRGTVYTPARRGLHGGRG